MTGGNTDIVRFRDLTEEERRVICNGCGSKGGIIKVPDFLFRASCDHHDFNYWLGCTEVDRERADRQFYEAMKRDVAAAAWWKRPFYGFWTWVYYRAVRFGGEKAFYYGPAQRTRKDLEREMQFSQHRGRMVSTGCSCD